MLAAALDRMAHQIKNPLQAIAVNLEVIRLRAEREAPELWSELDRFATALDENVRLLDRRLRLLLELRRAGSREAETVDLGTLLQEVVAAGGFDRDPGAVTVEAFGSDPAVTARRGALLELLFFRLLAAGAAGEAEETAAEVRVGEDGESGWLEVTRDRAAAADPSAVKGAAGRAGGELEVHDEGSRCRLRVRFPLVGEGPA